MTVPSPQTQKMLREMSAQMLQQLSEQALTTEAPSWIAGPQHGEHAEEEHNNSTNPPLLLQPKVRGERSPQCRFFDHAGFLKLDGFVDGATCQRMKEEMTVLVETEWFPERDGLDSFGTTTTQNLKRGDYFLESSDQVHYFAESGALEESENGTSLQLKAEYLVNGNNKNKVAALNKAGHALHCRPGSVFQEYCASEPIRHLLLDLGWNDPVVPQSMYIFKQAHTGGAVHSHQDSTFLFTTPRQTCIGLWLALDEATLENGCLWVRPCSHLHESTRRHYQRNVAHFGAAAIANRSNEACGDVTQPMFVMKDLLAGSANEPNIPWDGELPEDGSWEALVKAGFVPVECQSGDLLAFCGELDHLSLPNSSDQARHTFQLHCVEGPSAGVTWSEYNWLQYPKEKSFVRLIKSDNS